jgi:UDP:flavonoid glycosyltransferase YjiC (YdhE family)
MRGLLLELRDNISLLDDVPILVDARLASQMPTPADAQRFDYSRDDLSEVAAVVARPGMGTITDCISTNTALFCLSERSPEMEHNTQRLEALGVGWRLPEGQRVERIATWIDDASAREAHKRATASIDGRGLDEAIDAIVLHLN